MTKDTLIESDSPNKGSSDVKSFALTIFFFPITRLIIGALVCFLVSFLMNRFLFKPLISLFDFNEESGRMIRFCLNTIVLLSTYQFVFRYYEKREVTELHTKNLLRDGALGLMLAVSTIALIVFLLCISGFFSVAFERVTDIRILYPLVVLAFLAITEEIFYRGIFYRIVESRLGTHLALIASFLLFGLVHATNDHANMISVISAGAGGMLLSIMFSYSGRLWLPIFFHLGWNVPR